MAIIDKLLQVSSSQTVTATAVSTDVIDQMSANTDIGFQTDMHMVVTVEQAAAASGAATVQFVLQDSADNATFADVAASSVVPKAALTQGANAAIIPLPYGLRRYIRLNYIVASGPLTAGKFNAAVQIGVQRNNFQPAGTTT